MSKKMLIDATHAEETRVVVVDGNKVEEFDFESENKRQLAGNIYLAKVTRVEPSLQAAFVDYGGNRHGFLAFSEIHPDYYQIPVADREALLAEEAALAAEDEAEDERRKPQRQRQRRRPKAVDAASDDAVSTAEPEGLATTEADDDATARTAAAIADIPGMNVVDLVADEGAVPALVQEPQPPAPPRENDEGSDDSGRPYRAMDDAADRDDEVESVADEDVAEEISQPRRPRARRYKIQEVIKVRQILLVQVVKEERGNKGAALTTYLSLAGRYCVLMPNTARGGGISRKITNAADRKKLKEIASELDVPRGAGLIIRTAGSQRTKSEIKRDYEYLQRLWEQVRELTLRSIAPAKIYEEGDLIKRTIRDLYNRDIDEVLVEGEAGYRTAKDFMKMIMPSHAKNVRQHVEGQPLFAKYQVESYLSSMFNPVVQLKSGGYIVIGVTEALVAIDVNSGRATKEGSIEETALKTNLEAAEEVARQLRLRDLAGLIVVDFIDMEERKNNAAVEKRFKEKLKSDRARIQIGRISAFGLLEMSRQRLRPGMLEASTQPCPHCHGTGLLRSDDSLGLSILRELEEEGVRRRSKEVLLRAPIGIVNFLVNYKREHVAGIEARYGMSVRVEGDPKLVSPDYTIEKFKTQTRVVEAVPLVPVVSVDPSLMPDYDEPQEPEDREDGEESEAAGEERQSSADAGEGGQRRKRRRRRRRKNGDSREGAETSDAAPETSEERASVAEPAAGQDASTEVEAVEPAETRSDETGGAPRRRTVSRRGGRGRRGAAAEREPALGAGGEGSAEIGASETRSDESASQGSAATVSEASEAMAGNPRGADAAQEVADAAQDPAPGADQGDPSPAHRGEAPSPDATMSEAPAEERSPEPRGLPDEGSRTVTAISEPVEAGAPNGEPRPADSEAAGRSEGDGSPDEAPLHQPEPTQSGEPMSDRAGRAEGEGGSAESPPAEPEAEKPKRRGWWSLGR